MGPRALEPWTDAFAEGASVTILLRDYGMSVPVFVEAATTSEPSVRPQDWLKVLRSKATIRPKPTDTRRFAKIRVESYLGRPDCELGEIRCDPEVERMTRDDLMPLVIEALRANGGRARVVDVCRHIWTHHEAELKASGDLLYTWQYDVRWAAQKLRDTGQMKAVHSDRTRPWELARSEGCNVAARVRARAA